MPSPEETTARTREYLADHPEAEDALGALLEHDADGDPWTFAETDLDSGQFGELVSRDLATAVDDGYRLQYPNAIRAALDGPDTPESIATHSTATAENTETKGFSRPDISAARLAGDLQTRLALVGALLTVVAARLVGAPAVLRDGYVVSPANNTYFFRYWQERLAARVDGIFDVALFADMGGAASTRPLSHAINWWVTVLLGGVDAAPLVAAWLPIVTAAPGSGNNRFHKRDATRDRFNVVPGVEPVFGREQWCSLCVHLERAFVQRVRDPKARLAERVESVSRSTSLRPDARRRIPTTPVTGTS